MPDLVRSLSELRARLLACMPEKIAVWLGLALGICIPYFTLQHVELADVRRVPATALDHAVRFSPDFIWAYLSLGALVPLAPGLASDRDALLRYARGLATLCIPCFVVFALFPVEGPRPGSAPDHPLYRWLVSVDRPSNSMPSLHAGLVVYSVLFALRVLRESLSQRALAAVSGLLGVWALLILYATLATKQHWALDLPAGGLFAVCGHVVAWRGGEARVRSG